MFVTVHVPVEASDFRHETPSTPKQLVGIWQTQHLGEDAAALLPVHVSNGAHRRATGRRLTEHDSWTRL